MTDTDMLYMASLEKRNSETVEEQAEYYKTIDYKINRQLGRIAREGDNMELV